MILGIRRSSVLPHISSMPKGKGHPGAHQVTNRKKATEQRKVNAKSKTTTKNMKKKKPTLSTIIKSCFLETSSLDYCDQLVGLCVSQK